MDTIGFFKLMGLKLFALVAISIFSLEQGDTFHVSNTLLTAFDLIIPINWAPEFFSWDSSLWVTHFDVEHLFFFLFLSDSIYTVKHHNIYDNLIISFFVLIYCLLFIFFSLCSVEWCRTNKVQITPNYVANIQKFLHIIIS